MAFQDGFLFPCLLRDSRVIMIVHDMTPAAADVTFFEEKFLDADVFVLLWAICPPLQEKMAKARESRSRCVETPGDGAVWRR
jgi:hypothetical protein